MDPKELTKDEMKFGKFRLVGTDREWTLDELIRIANIEMIIGKGYSWARTTYGKYNDLANAIGNQAAYVYAYVIRTMDKRDNCFLFHRQDVAKSTGASISAIRRAMLSFLEHDIIRHVDGDKYMVNPDVINSGGNIKWKGLRKKYYALPLGHCSAQEEQEKSATSSNQ